MANTKVTSGGNLVLRWALPGFASNWKKPTVAEMNATLDITDSVAWANYSFGNQASNQVSDPSIADTGNVQSRGFRADEPLEERCRDFLLLPSRVQQRG